MMHRYLVLIAAVAVLGSGCSKEEEQAQKAPESTREQSAMSPVEQAQETASEAVDEASQMAEEAAGSVEQATEEAQAVVEEQAATAEAAVEEKAAEAEAKVEETVTEVRQEAAETMEQAAEEVAPAAGAGKATYDAACFACHSTGAAGAPKLGDKAAWEPRIAQGMAMLYNHAVNGIRAMPPKGGFSHLSDEEVQQAVDYMVGQSR